MTDVTSLDSIDIGKELRVVSVGGEPLMAQRLADLGVVRDTVIKCVMVSPLGDPKAYSIRGAVIALRREDAMHIFGQRVDSLEDCHDKQIIG